MARRVGFAVEREHGCPDDGTTMWAVRRIRILPGSEPPQATWALAHQLGHILLHEPVGRPPGTTTSGCTGVRKTEADSVAFIICTRYEIATAHEFLSPATWAGRDPRAQPPAVILTVGERITAAAARIVDHLDRHVPGPQAESSALADAQEFFTSQLPASWAPAYLHTRGLSVTAIGEWGIGYAPAQWTALTDHLRCLGHSDDAIRAAGLACVSSRGTLIDHFRDRVMLPVLNEHGALAGFIGRARPESDPGVPKYLNSPETATYRKGELLFGLHQARANLARGAIPVIAEGPFDAIAISLADPGRHVGLAPCGTALTDRQAAALAAVADLSRTGILAAFDNDNAGRKAAARAYDILRPLTGKLGSVQLAGKDPAEILQRDGPAALCATLRDQVQPLSSVIIDARIDTWERRLHDTGATLLAMRDAATLIARLLPPETAEQIRQITNDREISTTDDLLRPVDNPELPEIARLLPADTPYQIMQVADRLGFDASEVLAEAANAITRNPDSPKAEKPSLRSDMNRSHATPSPTRLAEGSFPSPSSHAHPASIQDANLRVIANSIANGSQLKPST